MIKKRLIALLKDSKKYIVYQVLCQWAMLLCQIAIVYEIADLVEMALTGFVDRKTAFGHALIILPAIIVRFIFDRLYVKASFAASVDVKKILRRSIYEKMLSLGSNYREYISSSEVVQLATEGVEQLETYFGKYLSQFFYSLLAPLTLFGFFCMVDIRSAAVLLICVPLIPVSIVIVMKIAKRLLSKYWGVYAELGDSFLDNLNGLTTLKIYGADAEKAEEMDKESEHFRKITMKVLTMQLNSTSVMDIMAYGGAAVGMIMALKGYSAGRNDISDTLMIILLAAEFFLPMRILGSYFHVAMNGMAASDKIFALLDIDTDLGVQPDDAGDDNAEQPYTSQNSAEQTGNNISTTEKTSNSTSTTEQTVNSASTAVYAKEERTEVVNEKAARDEYLSVRFNNSVDIKLTGVSYSYDGEQNALEGIDMDFPSGKLTSIVGLSGSGKSTLVGILSGRNRHYAGSVKISGCELNELPPDIRNSAVTIVTSDSYIFGGTIYDNLKIACPDVNSRNMIDALKQVGLLDELLYKVGEVEKLATAGKMNGDAEDNNSDNAELKRLAKILMLKLEEGGRNLSGGQRQRLSIARALLANSPVMIFDEATSNIDLENEQQIMGVIKKLARSKTIILISHRLGNVVSSDNIYMLDSGKIIGSGKHDSLVKTLSSYKQMYENQKKLESYNNQTGRKKASIEKVKFINAELRTYEEVENDIVLETATNKDIEHEDDSEQETVSGQEIVSEQEIVSGQKLNPSNVREEDVFLGDMEESEFDDGFFTEERRSGLSIMRKLIVLIRPLIPAMFFAVLLGSVGFMMAIMLTVIAAGDIDKGNYTDTFFCIMIGVAVMRGLLHYGEQYLNHYIAFKLLARIRHKVFEKLRELCPAKLDRKDKGNLIAIITSDIEKLEVFYAHTISPIMISIIVTGIIIIFLIRRSVIAGLVALLGYYLIGVIIPFVNGKRGSKSGMSAGNDFGSLNTAVLESLYGLDETIQYQNGDARIKLMEDRAEKLRVSQHKLSKLEADQKSFTNLTIQIINLIVLLIVVWQVGYGAIYPIDCLLVLTLVMSSYGPVVALSNLSNNLSNTLASGERVLSLLEEKPKVIEVISDTDQTVNGKENKNAKKKAKKNARQEENQEEKHSEEDGDENAVSEKLDIEITDARPEMQTETTGEATDIDTDVDTTPVSYIQNIHGIALENIYFSYGGKFVLQDMSMNIKGGQITAIHGPSGSGKSTILKLLMRFYDPQDGKVIISEAIGKDYDIKTIQSDTLRNMESYVTQETWLFHDTIRRNIEIGSLGATDEEIYEAAKKASIHDFIISLPNGYDTMIGESGDTLSDGERQRIGVARAFLHNAPVMILDEPTSNLDALNEGIILSSLEEEKGRSIILVSHRKSTVSIADKVFVSE